ncbi:hypothetical protein DET61_106119 [Marinobacter nauticus]|uniref:Uncharacterized protein n=1 Tax=Marinobacter nauticus TaxID=2743 RepID=A0A368XSN6_MARNT|nr:hypothetical protein [Marinobacter nauticus]RCW69024.1 hypothetical protein DET61_106119 [Marinobacter nauticus]
MERKNFYRRGGRPKKSEDDKRKSVLTLRLNRWERSKLRDLMIKEGWGGDKASFVRWFLLRELADDPIDKESLEKFLWAMQQVLLYGESNTSEDHKDVFKAADETLRSFASNMYKKRKKVSHDTSQAFVP